MNVANLATPPVDSKYEIAHLKLVPKRHIGRMIVAGGVLLLFAGLVRAFSVGQIEWSYVRDFLFAPAILVGLYNTLLMTVAAMGLGIVLGVVIAIMRISGNPVLSSIAIGYIWVFRGAPALLQLMLWFNLALIFPTLGIPGLFEFRTVDVMTPFVAAVLGLGISQGAYTSEVVRSGLLSVDSGQYEAARTIGMTQMMMLRRIVLPQAMRVMVPPVGNEVIGMVKLTSLASVIQYSEILHNAQIIYFANTRVLELLLVASFWYLLVVSVLSIGQHYIERYFGRGSKSIRSSM
ncbi:amino acid ABC transporter permease [Sinorhizobium meliloti]|uniref:Glutamate/aspartate import permease protein GltK n=1 Tax=Sinorhizobium meliloti CCNWSX0020 TaxID=1107881 RepID=H0G7W6_RHIML|nr:amino acid ABC transporter permease [Sinorhizobium meliloti]TWB02904.1 amino acid ABC transporter membrane protein (PAAT family) [Ensifer sp. SEMIA 134]TWB29452.1 amino acid ABC transporter membrane protein (PAAT family) [Ensifer sp. SEMIA 135]AEG08290.1 polar amino acid ABC transporter, inner membrane subunit [Sinorhizobium meliloti BL225C]EHK74628.1 polar amino acid ABC transporter inner membrane subunit [Sinorhizobium meliloti CCNWSX0020]MCO6423072.1 amino acid ABC transporter permease [